MAGKTRTPLEILGAVLGSVSKGGYASLARAHGLETAIGNAAETGAGTVRGEPAELFRKIAKLAHGIDTRPLAVKKERLEEIRRIYDELQNPGMFRDAPPPKEAPPKEPAAPKAAAPVPVADKPDTDKPAKPAAPQKTMPLKPHAPLDRLKSEVKWIKGVGPRLAEVLKRLEIHNVEDLLFHLPVRYDDLRHVAKIRDLEAGMQAVVEGEVKGTRKFSRQGREIVIRDDTGELTCKWFQGFDRTRAARAKEGDRVRVTGDCRVYRTQREFHHPDFEFSDEPAEGPKGIIPVYPLTEGLHPKQLRTVISNALEAGVGGLDDGLSGVEDLKVPPMPLGEAVRLMHHPPEDADIDSYINRSSPAHERLRVHEAFMLSIGLAIRRKQAEAVTGQSIPDNELLLGPFLKNLPFELTNAQKRVLTEIRKDLAKPTAMNRLMQGDVGAGKTVVALAAALIAVGAGYQVALMAPTEILAEQHFRTMTKLVKGLDIPIALLTGSQKLSTETLIPARVYNEMQRGTPMIAVGTHALIQDKVGFGKLGFVIIDEQHRFGVEQRQTLLKKGLTPDVLVMTATPIPRTLALTVYGDLSISALDEMPPGRKPIATKIVRAGEEKKLWDAVARQLADGRQAYVVYPLVTESELIDLKDAERAAREIAEHHMPGCRVGLLHGRMKPADKDRALEQFRTQKTQVLVSTTVIEVGIDIPNASVMVIEHAERFGLAQIHQLRGRVGRGSTQSYCYLAASPRVSGDALKRLRVLEESNDGFRIAEADLEIRGPGEFLGTRQSGLPEFRVLNLVKDFELLQSCRRSAEALLGRDPSLGAPQHRRLRAHLLDRWKGRIELGGVA